MLSRCQPAILCPMTHYPRRPVLCRVPLAPLSPERLRLAAIVNTGRPLSAAQMAGRAILIAFVAVAFGVLFTLAGGGAP